MSKPWYLSYTDSIYFDASSHQRIYRKLASDCEKKEGIKFGTNENYYINQECILVSPTQLVGNWDYFPDSAISYGSPGDTGVLAIEHIAYIKLITPDSLRTVQQSAFLTPDIAFKDQFEAKTYVH